ncbi:MAG: hypothetical protein Kow00128_04280 [Deltaproteobacteria bacterium]
MSPRILRLVFAGLIFAMLPAGGSAAVVPPSPESREGTVARFLDHGMPLSARSRFRTLPAEAQGSSPLLPTLLSRLAGAGYAEEALSLFEEVRPRLQGPVRSAVLQAAAEIHRDRGNLPAACRLFREASEAPDPPAGVLLRLGQCFAIEGKTAGAVALFTSARDRDRGTLLAGYAEMASGRADAARSAWSRAARGTPAGFAAALLALSGSGEDEKSLRALERISGETAVSFPEREAALSALSSQLLRGRAPERARESAERALREMDAWKAAATAAGTWDRTGAGGRLALAALSSLFPYGEDAAGFRRAGRRFRSRISLAEGERKVLNRLRETARRLRGAEEALQEAGKATERAIRRAEEIERTFRAAADRAGALRGRLANAADRVVLSEWGASIDPEHYASLEVADRRIRFLRDRLAGVSSLYAAKLRSEWSPPLAPADRLMVLTAQVRLDRIEQRIRAIESRMAFLRRTVWNRWKEEFASRASALLDRAGTVPETASAGAKRAGQVASRLRETLDAQSAWIAQIGRMRRRLATREQTLLARRSGLLREADRSLAEAVRELTGAISRRERALHYLAARAATEQLTAGPDGEADPAGHDPSPRDRLRENAVSHWNAVLSPAADPFPRADEALYALAELRFEEEERRFHSGPDPGGRVPDHAGSLALFRRVVREHPGSPYREAAWYGAALCLQEAGNPEESIRTMKALLAAYPGSRFADELHLRLGEEAFDRYDFDDAAREYREVGDRAPADLRATARFKLGWSLFLRQKPEEAAEAFLESLRLSREARRTGGIAKESLRMLARSLVESGREGEAESFLSRRGETDRGPSLLLAIQTILITQNRYPEAAGIADRFARTYPDAPGRIDAEIAAAEALRKGNRVEESHLRKAGFSRAFGPGSRWQAAPERTPADIARANLVAEEGLRTALFFFHGMSRKSPPGDRSFLAEGYDAYLSLYPAAEAAGEVAFQRGWFLFESGRKRESSSAFEEAADRYGGPREEAARYMAVQAMNDVKTGAGSGPESEVIRLARRYEQVFPDGKRLPRILLDRARAHFRRREFREAAEAAGKAAERFPAGKDRLEARRLSGDARFSEGSFLDAEREFRAVLAAAENPRLIGEMRKWIGFSMFRRAEGLSGEPAAALFSRVAEEFPDLEIVPTARFRAGNAFAESGNLREAIAAFRAVESLPGSSDLALDATRRLAVLYERIGDPLAAADRYERLARTEEEGKDRSALLLRAAELLAGRDEPRRRRILLAVAALPEIPPDTRISACFQAAESARGEGREEEADRLYGKTLDAQRDAPDVLPALAGRSAWYRGETRFARYRALPIAPPLERTFRAKQAALERASAFFLEAIRLGDGETVASSLHRLGEGFEEFRNALLASPVPKGLSAEEREEYRFLLEEKAAPIEEKAVEAYRKNLRQAVASNLASPWVRRSLDRLRALRPALFARRWEYAFPVMTIPVFRGIVERRTP